MAAPRVLVLGIGNILLSDEGVGVHVINRFQETFAIPDGVEVIDGGTMGLDLMPYFEGKSHVIVVDAMCADGEEPGTIEDALLPPFSTHWKEALEPLRKMAQDATQPHAPALAALEKLV